MRMPHAAPQLTFACVSDVSAKFKSFDWSYNKTTFPKAKDGGMADANVLGLSAEISFEMATNADAVMTIDVGDGADSGLARFTGSVKVGGSLLLGSPNSLRYKH